MNVTLPSFRGLLDPLREPRVAVAVLVPRRDVTDPAAGPQLVQRVVVEGLAVRVLVSVRDPAPLRVDEPVHLGERQQLVRDRLVLGPRRVLDPFVAARAVADEVRRQPADGPRLQVLAQRDLAARLVADVAAVVGVHPVLRAEVEVALGVDRLAHVSARESRRKKSISLVALKPVNWTESPVVPVTLISGPLFLRGTTTVAAARPAAGGRHDVAGCAVAELVARYVSGMIWVGSVALVHRRHGHAALPTSSCSA